LQAVMSKILGALAYPIGLVAAGTWGYFIWSFDWGTSWRGRGLWWMIFSMGMPLAFGVGVIVVFLLHSWLFPDKPSP
jgi:hypothetical protein